MRARRRPPRRRRPLTARPPPPPQIAKAEGYAIDHSYADAKIALGLLS